MVKVQAREAESFASQPPEGTAAVLLYGPDSGLVRERADRIARTVVDDLTDPFRVAELRPEDAAGNPGLLIDEVLAISLTGGRRVVRIKGATDKLADAIAGLLEERRGDAMVVVEAGELPGRSKLRSAFEKSGHAAALACYRDEKRDLVKIIADELDNQGVSADREASAMLANYLGGDRLLTRNELAKLALYVGPGGQASAADVAAVVADSSFLSHDRIAHAVAAGNLDDLDRSLERALAERESPIGLIGAVRRHLTRLHLYVGLGANAEALKTMRLDERRNFMIVGPLKEHARRWNTELLDRALERLVEAEIQCKSTGMPADTICRRAFFELAHAARRARR